MNKLYTSCIVLCIAFLVPSLAGAVTITDDYWGGAVFNASSTAYGDVIGDPYFKVASMDVTRSGKDWTVVITGEYFGYHQSNADSGFPKALGPGDLYINSNGWVANSGAGNYETDTFTNTEGWNYVVTKVGDSWGLYSLNFNTIDFTNVGPLGDPNRYIFRKDQAWRGGAGTLIGTAAYSLLSDSLMFTFNTGTTDFSSDVGFHWTMECGNDVIEGKAHVPVPEPGTMMLLGSGLVGLAEWGRKKFRK